jgi:hypothetical protein
MIRDRTGRADSSAEATCLLHEAINRSRFQLGGRSITAGDRLRRLWAVAKHTRHFASRQVHENEFLRLADEVGLIADLGRDADGILRHVIRWAWRGMNPFPRGSLT